MLFNFVKHVFKEKSKNKTTFPLQKLVNKEYMQRTPGFAFLFPCQTFIYPYICIHTDKHTHR